MTDSSGVVFVSLSSIEIVQLATGEIVVKRAGKDKDSEPLLTIAFSPESKSYLDDATMDVAKAMVRAGIEAAFEMGLAEGEFDQLVDDVAPEQRTLH